MVVWRQTYGKTMVRPIHMTYVYLLELCMMSHEEYLYICLVGVFLVVLAVVSSSSSSNSGSGCSSSSSSSSFININNKTAIIIIPIKKVQ